MDLGISGRKAIVCAASRGLGRACAESLAREGVSLTINSRNQKAIEATATELEQAYEVSVNFVVGDIGDASIRAELLEACGQPDILVNNNGGPKPGRSSEWTSEHWIEAFEANMIAPTEMIRSVIDGMVERNFGRIVNITSAMVKRPMAPMGLSTAARTALTAFCKGLSRDVVSANVTINNLLPELIDTDRQKGMAKLRASMTGGTVEQAYEEMRSRVAANRLGRPDEFGDACAFLCSAQAGYISGQNLQLDGGSYPGLI